MKRIKLGQVVMLAAIGLVVVSIAANTEWGEVTLPSPLRGEAARNPFYAAERLIAELGATSERRQTLEGTSPTAVVVLSTWGWDINTARRLEFERWVESGGRLVTDAALITGNDAFTEWSGIAHERAEPVDDEPFAPPQFFEPCQTLLQVVVDGMALARSVFYEGCNFDRSSWFVADRNVDWALAADDRYQIVRTRVGEGAVTAINAVPFLYRELLEGHHGELLVAAAELRAGDHVVFISEEDYASLPTLIWRHGSPVVVVAALALALALWRGAKRFGPLVAPSERARRSLGEQILGTGRFTLRVGGGAALRAAAIRALHAAAARRIANYAGLESAERAAAVARFAQVDAAAVAVALAPAERARVRELRDDLALLENARRQLLSGSQWSKHGKPT